MKKMDIMNMRNGEEWIIVNGKETLIEKKIIVADTVEKAPVKDIKKPVATNISKPVKEGKNARK